MENYTCQKCGKEIPQCNRVLHDLSCNNTISNDEFKDLIPCEYCNHLISFVDYTTHVRTCENQLSFFPTISNLFNAPLLSRNTTESRNIPVENNSTPDNLPLPRLFTIPALQEQEQEQELEQAENEEAQPHQEWDFFSALDDILERIQNDGTINIPNLVPNPDDNNYENLTNLGETIGNVEIGLDNPTEYLIEKNYNLSSPFFCEICSSNKLKTLITACKHEFCYDCSMNWFSSSKKCPYCNTEIQKILK